CGVVPAQYWCHWYSFLGFAPSVLTSLGRRELHRNCRLPVRRTGQPLCDQVVNATPASCTDVCIATARVSPLSRSLPARGAPSVTRYWRPSMTPSHLPARPNPCPDLGRPS